MITRILDVFEHKNITSVSDNFSNYECRFVAKLGVDFQVFSQEEYEEFNSVLSNYDYEWMLTIDEASYSISQIRFELLELDEDIDEAQIQLSIFKKGQHVVIFDEEVFFKFLKSQSFQQVLESLKRFEEGLIIINNFILNKDATSFIALNTELLLEEDYEVIISSLCNYSNLSQYRFSPNFFEFQTTKDEDYLLDVLKKIQLVFNLIYLFDYSEISGDNVSLKITGHKTFTYDLDFRTIDTTSNDEYSKIFKWVYSETTKIEDKLGLSRNILTIYLRDDSINIDDKVFFSILSANNTYIKENISRYIDVRTKVHTQVEQISEKVSKSVEGFFSNFQKSIFIFISFYLTIFVLKIYTKPNVSDLLNRETTYVGIGLLGLSFVFLLFSNLLIFIDLNRIEAKYADVKKRALDLLVYDDVNKILDNDSEFKSEKKFLWKRIGLCNLLWIITIVVFFNILTYTSSHI